MAVREVLRGVCMYMFDGDEENRNMEIEVEKQSVCRTMFLFLIGDR